MIQQGDKVIHQTKSLCPVCLSKIEAFYEERDGEVWFVKECSEHGKSEILFWSDAEGFKEWNKPSCAYPPPTFENKEEKGCPYDCGLCENHKQSTCCVLLEVTGRCDLLCPICFADAKEDDADPSLFKIKEWYKSLMEKGGPFNIQLSGGEPTMRDDLDEIIRTGKNLGFDFFQLNTNGLRIAREPDYLKRLKEAGLNTVFLQFDSLHGDETKKLRGRDIVEEKLKAIENCRREKLGVVLVPTVKRDVNHQELGEILAFAKHHMPTVRGVHFQPMAYFGRYEKAPGARERITIPEILGLIEEQTGGKLKASDFYSGNAEHPLCSFNVDYIIRDNKWVPKVKQGNSSCCCNASTKDTSRIAREAVAEKWRAPTEKEQDVGEGFNLDSLDAFIKEKEEETLAISGMAFQDVWSVDLERLERCYINIISPEGKRMPFCSYNITSSEGVPLHRK